MRGVVLPVMTLAWREVIRFCRQRSRLVGAFVQPLIFWILLGGGLRASFQPPGTPPGTSYVEYVYHGILFLVLAPVAGISLSVVGALTAIAVMFLVSFGLTCLGLVIAWRLDSTQGFHAIMNLILLPMWVLSGAFFPATGVPKWIGWTMQVNPLTYGMAAIRRCLYLGSPTVAGAVPALGISLAITVLFGLLAFVAATGAARRCAT